MHPHVPLHFRFIDGPKHAGATMAVEETYSLPSIKIGSTASCALRLDGDGVARLHAVIDVNSTEDRAAPATPVEVLIMDLGSALGTYVNGKKVSKQVLAPGDKIAIGQHLFEVLWQHAFVPRSTTKWEGPPAETCEHCGTDPRNNLHDQPPAVPAPDPTTASLEALKEKLDGDLKADRYAAAADESVKRKLEREAQRRAAIDKKALADLALTLASQAFYTAHYQLETATREVNAFHSLLGGFATLPPSTERDIEIVRAQVLVGFYTTEVTRLGALLEHRNALLTALKLCDELDDVPENAWQVAGLGYIAMAWGIHNVVAGAGAAITKGAQDLVSKYGEKGLGKIGTPPVKGE